MRSLQYFFVACAVLFACNLTAQQTCFNKYYTANYASPMVACGCTWVVNDNSGLYGFNPESGDKMQFKPGEAGLGTNADLKAAVAHPDGGLWCGGRGLYYFDGVSFQQIEEPEEDSYLIQKMMVDTEGNLLVQKRYLWRLEGESWVQLTGMQIEDFALTNNSIFVITEAGNLIVIGSSLSGSYSMPAGSAFFNFYSLAAGNDGSVWITEIEYNYFGPSWGKLWNWKEGTLTRREDVPSGLQHIFQSENGTLWMASDRKQYRQEVGAAAEEIGLIDLPGKFYQDELGTVWWTTARNVFRWEENDFVSATPDREGDLLSGPKALGTSKLLVRADGQYALFSKSGKLLETFQLGVDGTLAAIHAWGEDQFLVDVLVSAGFTSSIYLYNIDASDLTATISAPEIVNEASESIYSAKYSAVTEDGTYYVRNRTVDEIIVVERDGTQTTKAQNQTGALVANGDRVWCYRSGYGGYGQLLTRTNGVWENYFNYGDVPAGSMWRSIVDNDGNLWVLILADPASVILRVSPQGVIKEMPSPAYTGEFTVDAKGALWFEEPYGSSWVFTGSLFARRSTEYCPEELPTSMDQNGNQIIVGRSAYSLYNPEGVKGIVIENPDFLNLVECMRDGVEGIPLVEIEGWPNPTSDLLQIQLSGNLVTDASLEIYNVSGQLVDKQTLTPHSGRTLRIDVDSYEQGLYFMVLSNGETQRVKKFAVQRR